MIYFIDKKFTQWPQAINNANNYHIQRIKHIQNKFENKSTCHAYNKKFGKLSNLSSNLT